MVEADYVARHVLQLPEIKAALLRLFNLRSFDFAHGHRDCLPFVCDFDGHRMKDEIGPFQLQHLVSVESLHVGSRLLHRLLTQERVYGTVGGLRCGECQGVLPALAVHQRSVSVGRVHPRAEGCDVPHSEGAQVQVGSAHSVNGLHRCIKTI